MTVNWRDAVAGQFDGDRLRLDADLASDLFGPMRDAVLTGRSLTLEGCARIDLPQELMGFEGKTRDLRGQDGEEVQVCLVLFDGARGEGTAGCILTAVAQGKTGVALVQGYLADFDADLDMAMTALEPLPCFAFCSTEAPPPAAVDGAKLGEDWPAEEGLRCGVNLAFGTFELDDEVNELIELVFGEGCAKGMDAASVRALVYARTTGFERYWELDAPSPMAHSPALSDDDTEAEDEDEGAREARETGAAASLLGSTPAVMLAFDLPVGTGSVHLAGLEPSLSGAAIALQLSGSDPVGSDMVMRLTLGEDDGTPVELTARANMLTGELTFHLVHLPKASVLLNWLAGLVSTAPSGTLLPGELGKLLDVRVSDAVVALRPFPPNAGPKGETTSAEDATGGPESDDLDEGARERALIQTVGFALESADPIPIVPDICTFKPSARIRIDDPVSEWRQIVGVLEGKLTIGAALEAEARLFLPSGRFAASATVQLGEACEALGAKGCPEKLRDMEVTLALAGDARSGSLSAELRLADDKTWEPELPGGPVEFRELIFAVSHEGGEGDADPATTTFHVGATLVMPHGGDEPGETRFAVNGGWDGGWYVVGEMDGTIDLSEAVRKLAGNAPTPDKAGNLVLADLVLSADFNARSYALRGRTEGEWKPFDDLDLTLTIERVQFERTDSGTATDIACRINFDQIHIRCRAAKKAGEDGWAIDGRTLQDIDLVTLATDLDKKLNSDIAARVPSDFMVTDLSLKVVTGKTRKVTFAIAGHLKIGETLVEATLQVATASGTDGSTTVNGKLQIGDVPIEGVFLSEHEQQLFAGGFAPVEGKSPHFDLGGAVSDLLGDQAGAVPAFSIDLNRLVFLWRKAANGKAPEEKAPEEKTPTIQAEAEPDAKASGFFLDAALGTSIVLDLSQTLPIGAALGIPRFELKEITARYASAQFEKATLETINNASDLGLGHVTIEKGFTIAGKLAVGDGEPLTLSLSPPDAGNGAPEKLTSPAEGAKNTSAPGSLAIGDDHHTGNGGESDNAAKWFDIDKSVGPLHVGRVGVGFSDGKLGVMLDSDVDLAGLHVGLTGFALHFALKQPPKPSVSLDGLALGYSGGPVTVSGAFLRNEQTNKETGETTSSYDGAALIEAANFTIAGFGSYATVDQEPSMFIYAVLIAELGGPPAFRVRGLAAGFGYNRKLTLPKVDAVQRFPLIKAVAEPGNAPGGEAGKLIDGMMSDLACYVAPSAGEYWVAAGIRFNSFELIEAVALVSVSFGTDVEIGLLGLAQMSLPRGVKKGHEIAYAELALRASIKPEDGTAFIEGRLTEASFILSRSCRLTGGFALMFWFAGKNEGDFVVTLGGYHPRFDKPPHYPVVPRLGVHWEVTSELLVTAEMYFALTPHCIMAGGRLSAVYSSRRVRAWFIAHADFLLQWEPLAYTAEVGVMVGVEVDLSLCTLRVSLSVDLELWGPPFGGIVTIDLSVISIDIPFGADRKSPTILKAEDFERAFLPHPNTVVAARITAGLLQDEVSDNETLPRLRVVNAHRFRLSLQSAVPIEIHGPSVMDLPVVGEPAETRAASKAGGTQLGVAPMASSSLGSRLCIDLFKADGDGKFGDDDRVPDDRFIITGLPGNVPAALWQPRDNVAIPKKPPAGNDMTLAGTVGLSLVPASPETYGTLEQMRLEEFASQQLSDRQIPTFDGPGRPPTDGEDGGLDRIMSDAVKTRRSNVLGVLAKAAPFRLLEPDLSMLAGNPDVYFKHDPIIGAPLGYVDERAEQ